MSSSSSPVADLHLPHQTNRTLFQQFLQTFTNIIPTLSCTFKFNTATLGRQIGNLSKFGGVEGLAAAAVLLCAAAYYTAVTLRKHVAADDDKKTDDVHRRRQPVFSRSMSIGALHGGQLAIQRLVEYHDARANRSSLQSAETALDSLLSDEFPDFKKLQVRAA